MIPYGIPVAVRLVASCCTPVASLPALGPWAPPAERGPSLESIYRVSLTADLCEGDKIISLKIYFTTANWGLLRKKIHGPWARAQCAHWLRRPCCTPFTRAYSPSRHQHRWVCVERSEKAATKSHRCRDEESGTQWRMRRRRRRRLGRIQQLSGLCFIVGWMHAAGVDTCRRRRRVVHGLNQSSDLAARLR